MADEVHPVVELLVARMGSHPEEFKDDYMMAELSPANGSGRWVRAIRAIRESGLERDVEALNYALSKIRMQQIHEWTMDELLNGDDRRRAEEEDKKRLWLQQQQLHQQAYQQSPHLQSGTALLGTTAATTGLQLGEDSLMQQIRKRLIK